MEIAKTVDELTKKNVEAISSMEKAAQEKRTRGELIADRFASLVGSWPFIIVQSVVLFFWVTANLIGWIRAWDPYPFILLNLALSFQAAYASPIIMMSQNRQARISEKRNKLDLQINLLTEQENTEMLQLLRKICDKLNIPLSSELNLEALEQRTEPKNLIEQIESNS